MRRQFGVGVSECVGVGVGVSECVGVGVGVSECVCVSDVDYVCSAVGSRRQCWVCYLCKQMQAVIVVFLFYCAVPFL